MNESEINDLLAGLILKDAPTACGAMEKLKEESARSDAVYSRFDDIAKLLGDKNSYVRNRALLLLAANAHWDRGARFGDVIDEYLSHVTDEKPITARQCVQSLSEIARYCPKLRDRIRAALSEADVSGYADSMRPLLEKDIAKALEECAGL